jgi:outer membrane biosynthesis protein TonB
MRLTIIAAGLMFATASVTSAAPLNSISPVLNDTPVELAQAAPKANPEQKNVQDEKKKAAPQKMTQPAAQPKKEETMTQKKKEETMTQKVKRTWRNWTTPSHTFCVRTPIPVPLTSKTCTAKGKTVEEARSVCVRQNPLSYVSQGKC